MPDLTFHHEFLITLAIFLASAGFVALLWSVFPPIRYFGLFTCAGVIGALVLAGIGTALLVAYVNNAEDRALEGEEVVLQDVDRLVRGRVLTFKVGEDRIRVDGQEETRTEAIFGKRDTPTP